MHQQFSEIVQFKAPDGFLSAVSTLARRDYCTVSEFIRRCVISRLREEGVAIQPRDQSVNNALPSHERSAIASHCANRTNAKVSERMPPNA
jgi:hypothetical protein